MTSGEKPAFPYSFSEHNRYEGMTYREWLIGQALSGLLASDSNPDFRHPSTKALAEAAVEAADAVIEAINCEAK